MDTTTATNPRTRRAEFRFVIDAAEVVATSAFYDGANRHPYGCSSELLRTARGRWVWRHYSQWVSDPYVRVEAATLADGRPVDPAHVESFLSRFGDPEDLERWREDIAQPLPLA